MFVSAMRVTSGGSRFVFVFQNVGLLVAIS